MTRLGVAPLLAVSLAGLGLGACGCATPAPSSRRGETAFDLSRGVLLEVWAEDPARRRQWERSLREHLLAREEIPRVRLAPAGSRDLPATRLTLRVLHFHPYSPPSVDVEVRWEKVSEELPFDGRTVDLAWGAHEAHSVVFPFVVCLSQSHTRARLAEYGATRSVAREGVDAVARASVIPECFIDFAASEIVRACRPWARPDPGSFRYASGH